MFRIGITQRVEERAGGGERRDCLDQAWATFLEPLGALAVPIPNLVQDVAGYVDELGLAGVILSGGNDLAGLGDANEAAPERDACEHALLRLSSESGMPVLGVCRGLQIMAQHYGAILTRIDGHVATRHPVYARGGGDLIPEDRESVNSFHRWALREENLPPVLGLAAIGLDDTVEAIRHLNHRQAAVMWHPERGEPDSRDAELIRAFFGVRR